MNFLTEKSYRRLDATVRYRSITGGQGVRVNQRVSNRSITGGGGTGGATGQGLGPAGIPGGGPDTPYDPYAPVTPSTVLGPDRPNIYGAGYQPR